MTYEEFEEKYFNDFEAMYTKIMSFNPVMRLAFALTILDEAAETLGINSNDINSLRATIYNKLGDIY